MNDEQKPFEQKQMMDTATSRNKRPSARSAKLPRNVQARLGQQLRAMYDDVVSQGVPDRFTELLNRLNTNDSKDRH